MKKLVVRTLVKDVVLQVGASSTVVDVKAMMYQAERITPRRQVLVYNGRVLEEDERLLSDFGIQHESTLQLNEVPLCEVSNKRHSLPHDSSNQVSVFESFPRLPCRSHVLQDSLSFTSSRGIFCHCVVCRK